MRDRMAADKRLMAAGLRSAIDRSLLAKGSKQRQQRKADNREVVAVDLLEQLNAFALDLVCADA